MKILLSLHGSPAAIGAFLATVPADLLEASGDANISGVSTAAQLPGAVPPPVVTAAPLTVPPMPTLAGDDDDEGEDDGTSVAGEIDANGYPWDARIHAKSKGKNSDGTWRMKRNVAEATVAAVQAEFAARGPAPLMPVPLTAAPMPTQMPPMPEMPPVGLPPLAAAPAPVVAPAPVMPPVVAPQPAPAPAPAPVAAPTALDFGSFMSHLTTKMQTGEITMEYLQGKIAAFNAAWAGQPGFLPVNAVTDLNDPSKLQYMVQLFQMDGKW